MEKYKRALLALVVAAAITGTTQNITASTSKRKAVSGKDPSSDSVSFSMANTNLAANTEEDDLEKLIPEKKHITKVEKTVVAKEVKTVKPAPSTSKNAAAKSTSTSAVKKSSSTASTTSKTKTAAASKKTTKTVASRGKAAPVPADKASAVIDYAKQFMGIKYVFGGATPSGFDCSGFTMYVFQKINISLPHSASAQANMGIAVSKSELMPGDLVFFETYKKGISHVGIYIGGGQFIEASSSRGIAITSLSSSYYLPRYKGATRIIK